MMKKLNYEDSKPTKMVLTLANIYVTYLYGIMKYVLLKFNDYVFIANFIIPCMEEDSDVSFLLARPFLVTVRSLIDMEVNELLLRFKDEYVIFNVFEATRDKVKVLSVLRLTWLKILLKKISN